jgi:hypothetical protein
MTNGLPGREGPRSFRGRIVFLARLHPGIALAILVSVAAIFYLALGPLWTGDRGKATKALDAVVKGLVDANTDEVMACVSPYFAADGLDKRELGEALKRILKPGLITHASLYVPRFDVEGGRATATVEVRSSQRSGLGAGSIRSEWLVMFERIDGRWLIRAAVPLQVARQDTTTLRTLLASHR